MSRTLRLKIGKIIIDADLFSTPTADALYAAAPFEARVTTWGQDVYFTIPLHLPMEEDAREVLELGELAFRVEGEAVELGFGPTPRSLGKEIRLARPANIWGRTHADLRQLRHVEPGQLIRVEPLETTP